MEQRIKAVFEHGVIRPIHPIQGVAERARLDVTFSSSDESSPSGSQAALQACVGTISREDAAEMTRIVEAEFERVDPRDW